MEKTILLLFLFLALLQPQTVIAKKFLTSSEQPLATSDPIVQKLDKAIHWVNHYPVRVSDFSGG